MQAPLDEFRLAYQCISGWVIMLWRSQDDFEEGIQGHRRAPRALAWFDLRTAYDVCLDVGDPGSHVAPHRITVTMKTGNYYFCVEMPEDVPVWYEAIWRLIQDARLRDVRAKDTELHQRKRWPAACGIVEALLRGGPIGDRAMAVLFHAYDMNYDCYLQVGELMVLLQELAAALLHASGHGEGVERNTAVFSTTHRVPEDDLFDKAMQLRRRLCSHGDGKVRKDDFVRCGPVALSEALAGLGLMADLGISTGAGGDDSYLSQLSAIYGYLNPF